LSVEVASSPAVRTIWCPDPRLWWLASDVEAPGAEIEEEEVLGGVPDLDQQRP
jgi:hypothetical protein